MEYSKNTKYVIMQYLLAGLGREFWNRLINRQCGKHSTAPESINFVKNWNRKYAKLKKRKIGRSGKYTFIFRTTWGIFRSNRNLQFCKQSNIEKEIRAKLSKLSKESENFLWFSSSYEIAIPITKKTIRKK